MADLRLIQPEPLGRNIAEVIEEALLLAEQGELSSVVVVAVKRDGAPHWAYSAVPNSSTLIGTMERAKAELIGNVDD